MIPFPFTILVVWVATLLGVAYVTIGRVRWAPMQVLGRIIILSVTWTLPLATQGPGPAQLTLGLLVGFLGIRMVALGERWRGSRLPPSPVQILVAMMTPEELLAAVPLRASRPGLTLLGGLFGVAVCIGLLVAGNTFRIWRWSRLADDLTVFAEVAIGTAGVHNLIVGAAGLAGRSVAGLQDRPLLSASLSQFWSRRWNRLVQGNLNRGFFRPYGRRRLWALGTFAAFGASGVMHVIAVLDTERIASTLAPSAAVMGFFLLHAALVLGERRLGLHHQPQRPSALLWARVRTVTLFALLSPLLLDPFASVVHVHGRMLGP
jgi:Membrane bound O-acyl transferase family